MSGFPMINLEVFFGIVREKLFGGSMTAGQVSGCEAIIKAFEDRGINDLRFAGYGLATSYLEDNKTMQPIHEMGGTAYFTKLYDINGSKPALAKQLGNVMPGDGARFHGRGFVQLTGRANYVKAGQKLGLDLAGNPDLALQADIAADIMVMGMTEGWFTGKKLSDYFSTSKEDYVNARRIINGTDRASEIAGYAKTFVSALRAAATPETVATQPLVPAPPPAPYTSGTALGTYGLVGSGVLGAAKSASDAASSAVAAAQQAHDTATSAWALVSGLGPWVALALIVCAIGGYVVYRHRAHELEAAK